MYTLGDKRLIRKIPMTILPTASFWKKMSERLARGLGAALQLQLLLMLIALPLMSSAGLPFSTYSLLGNMLLAPLGSLLLGLCALLFFTSLLHAPNTLVQHLLNSAFDGWLWLLEKASVAALVAIPPLPTALNILLVPCTLWLAYTLRRYGSWQKAFCYALLIAVVITLARGLHQSPAQVKLTSNGSSFFYEKEDGVPTLTIIKTPARTCYSTFARMQVRSALTRATGRCYLKKLYVQSRSCAALKLAAALCRCIQIEELILPLAKNSVATQASTALIATLLPNYVKVRYYSPRPIQSALKRCSRPDSP
jgi:hypothetical protein